MKICYMTILVAITEKGDLKIKTEALKKVLFMILNGEKLPGLLMTIIRFILPLQVRLINIRKEKEGKPYALDN